MTTSVTDDRAMFEAWAHSEHFSTAKFGETYVYSATNSAWEGYQAALRSRPIEVVSITQEDVTMIDQTSALFEGTEADELRSLSRRLSAALAYSRPIAEKASQAALRSQGKVVEDAERYRKVRNAPIGVAGVPCIALPTGDRSGDFVNGEHADAVVDGLPLSEVVATTVPVEAIRNVIDTMQIARDVKTDNGGDWETGYACAVDSICESLTAIIGEGD